MKVFAAIWGSEMLGHYRYVFRCHAPNMAIYRANYRARRAGR